MPFTFRVPVNVICSLEALIKTADVSHLKISNNNYCCICISTKGISGFIA